MTSVEYESRLKEVESHLSRQKALEEEVIKHVQTLITEQDNIVSRENALQKELDQLGQQINEANVLIQESHQDVKTKQAAVSATTIAVAVAKDMPYSTNLEATSMNELRLTMQAEKVALKDFIWKP